MESLTRDKFENCVYVSADYPTNICDLIHREFNRLNAGLSASYSVKNGEIVVLNHYYLYGPYKANELLECLAEIPNDIDKHKVLETITDTLGK